MLKRIDPRKCFAYVVGVSNYDEIVYPTDEIKNLFEKGVSNSASRLAQCLISEVGISGSSVRHLESPSAQGLLSELAVESSQEVDCCIFFFCGHAILSKGSLYLGCRDLKPASPQVGGVHIKEIFDLIDKSTDGIKIIVLDCCYGGAAFHSMEDSFSISKMRSEINLMGSFAVASAGENVPALVPAGSDFTAFTGTACDILENGIEYSGPLISIDELFREIRRKMSEYGFTTPVRVSSIDDDLIAIAANPQFIPDNEKLRMQLNLQSERLQVYGRYFRKSNESMREAIDNLRKQDAAMRDALTRVDKADEDLRSDVSSLSSLKSSFSDVSEELKSLSRSKIDVSSVNARMGWAYATIVLSVAVSALVTYLMTK
jgi:Caspase domain